MERINRRGRGSSGTDGLSPLLAEQRRGWSLLISCARPMRAVKDSPATPLGEKV